MPKLPKCTLALAVGMAFATGAQGGTEAPLAPVHPWMSAAIIAEQAAASSDAAREAIARERARKLIAAMTLAQKLQQLTGSVPEIVPELPECKGGRHVQAIAALSIPTFRVTNGPVGLGQNDCVSASVPPVLVTLPTGEEVDHSSYSHPSSAKATALPSAMAAAASFDESVAAAYGELIGTEMLNLALHEFEAPGMNLARLPILGRNFEYFGEDPYLTGRMSVAEIKAIQSKGLIAMAKHFLANEQETNRTTIQESIDRQVLRELYLLPFEMSVKDGRVASVMCAYNYVNGLPSCESRELLTDILRSDWGFTGYVQSDFFATKTMLGSMNAGMDFMMPTPQQWTPDALRAALADGTIVQAQIDLALERRYTQMFKYGIFDRPVKATPIDFVANGRVARDIGTRSAVLLQNNGALPFSRAVQKVVVIGKATQVYAQQAVAGGSMVGKTMGAGGGSSDVVPNYTVSPVQGLQNVLRSLGNTSATVTLVTVEDDNSDLAAAVAAARDADAVIVMAGTISEEGADRATFTSTAGRTLAGSAAEGSGLDWYADRPSSIATTLQASNPAKNSQTVAMIKAIQAAAPTRTALVLKDNAGVAMDPALVGPGGPAILEVWFPGQEDGHIVADLLFGVKNPSGKLPVTFPFVGQGFLDNVSAAQYPGTVSADGGTNTVEYAERLHIGYRWYDANQVTPAFPFGHGLSYTTFSVSHARVVAKGDGYEVKATVRNTGRRKGQEVVQVYVSLPAQADGLGAPQPPRRLVGFRKVELAPGASREVTITIDPAASNHPLSVWSQAANRWVTPSGNYSFHVGNSSRNLSTVAFTR